MPVKNAARARKRILRAPKASIYAFIPAAVLAAYPGVAFGQVAEGAPAPEAQVTDENGVDLLSGMLDLSTDEVSIGTQDIGLKRTLSFYSKQDNNQGSIKTQYPNGSPTPYTFVSADQVSAVFSYSGGIYTPVDGSGATLTFDPVLTIYTFTSSEGVVSKFGIVATGVLGITSTLRPDGFRTDYAYDTRGRVLSVRNSAGYGLFYSYSGDYLAKVSAINLNRQYCAPSPIDCTPTSSANGRSYTYNTAISSSSTGSSTVYPGQSTTVNVDSYSKSSLSRTTLYRLQTNSTVFSSVAFPGQQNSYWTTSQGQLIVTKPRGGVSTYLFGKADSQAMGAGDIASRVVSVNSKGLTWSYSWHYTGLQGAHVTSVDIGFPGGGGRNVQLWWVTPWSTRITSSTLYPIASPARTTAYTYDTSARVTRVTNPEGDYFDYVYDGRGNITSVTHTPKPGSTLAPTVVQYGYPTSCVYIASCNKPSYTIDARGYQTDYTYDPVHGGMLTETGPADVSGIRPQKRYTYQQISNSTLNASGQLVVGSPVWKLVSVSMCQTLSSCTGTSDETVSSYTYDANLQPVTDTSVAGSGSMSRTTTKTYDGIGNVVLVDGPEPGNADSTRFQFDADRELTAKASADPDGNGSLGVLVSRSTFDADGNETLSEAGSAVDQSDAALAAMTVSDSTSRSFDLFNRETSETLLAQGAPYAMVQYSYDSAGRLECSAVRMNPAVFASLNTTAACVLGTEGTFGKDRITKNVYDAAGELLQIMKGVGTSLEQIYVTNTYSLNGKQTTLKDANGNVSSYTYDGFDRLIAWVFPSKTVTGSSAACTIGSVAETTEAFAAPGGGTINVPVSGPTETHSAGDDCEKYAYDRNGNPAKLMKRDGNVIRYTFDALNRNVVKDIPGGTVADVYYGYDLRGLQTFANFASASGTGITNVYNAFGELVSTTNNMGMTPLTLGYLYDTGGNRIRVTHPDGNYFTYDYDGLDRATTIKANGASTIATIAYDSQGRRLGDTRSGASTTYGYDPVSRVANLSNELAGTAGDVTSTFVYNPANQIVTKTRSNDAYAFSGYVNVSRIYTVNGLNQYATAGSATFTYDDNGNLTGDGTNTYTYDVENRMVSATMPTGTAQFTYDPLGRLWHLVRVGSTNGGAWEYLYDGDDIVARYNASFTATGVPTLGLRDRFVFGPGTDDPLIWYLTGSTNSPMGLQSDYQGSIVSAADLAGNLYGTYAYDEYGIQSTTMTGNKPIFGYTGQLYLPEVGLNYYKARMYSPTLGRFMQTDPIGYDDQANLYGYVSNDPLNGTDPLGLAACPEDLKKQKKCVDDPKTETGKTPQPGPDPETKAKDEIVVTARRKREMSDGTKIQFPSTGDLEQGFRVDQSGISAVPFTVSGTQQCEGDDYSSAANKINVAGLGKGASGGHTHGGGELSPLPGDEDGRMAAATGQTGYVISQTGAYAVEKTAVGFRARVLGGGTFTAAQRQEVRGLISRWNKNNGASGKKCTFTPNK